ncbi:MAG TPA: hypothetical protein VM736_04230 [Gemmatimonadales bacterium]|nr:hypothetical protein [Gemmatimonadales bacterium]
MRLPCTSIADVDLLTIGGGIANRFTPQVPERRAGGGRSCGSLPVRGEKAHNRPQRQGNITLEPE